MEVHATVIIGAYFIIRGLSLFFGGFPYVVETIAQLEDGNFNLSVWFYLYFLLFVVLSFAGNWFQQRIDLELLKKKLAAEHDNESKDNFVRQKTYVDGHH